MRIKKILFLILLLLIGFNAFSQDPSFSQFYFNQTYFNPAFAGISGGTNAGITYRRQWINLPGKFETFFLNLDSDLPSVNNIGGYGINVFRDVQGEGFLTTTGASLMSNVIIQTHKSAYLKFGVSLSMYSKTVDWSNFTFGDQLDPVLGIIRPTGFKAPTDVDNIFPDLTFGTLYLFGHTISNRNTRKDNYNGIIGFAIQHINEPNESFLGQNSKLPMKLVFHANLNIAINHDADMIFSPCVVYERQKVLNIDFNSMNTLFGGFNIYWNGFFIGPWTRFFSNSDAIIFNVGIIQGNNDKRSNNFRFSYSYDLTISSLSSRATGGSHEISFNYYFHKEKKTRSKGHVYNPPPCPTFN